MGNYLLGDLLWDLLKITGGVVLDDERIENLAAVFPLQYLIMFEQMKKNLEKRD